jgi:hypothetical protein
LAGLAPRPGLLGHSILVIRVSETPSNVAPRGDTGSRVGTEAGVPELIPPDGRVAVSSGVSREEPKRLALGNELNHAQRELLDAAVNDPAGQISDRRVIGPDQPIVNGRNHAARRNG